MILVIDNYDSFVHNLARYCRCLGHDTHIVRNDAISIQDIQIMGPSHIILSPGPCSPDEAGICLEIIKSFKGKIPILGICLGHQAIGQALGGRIIRASNPRHGEAIELDHNQQGLFSNIPKPLSVGLYHSLVIDPSTLPLSLKIDAQSQQGDIMAIRDCHQQLFGLQFHPESILTTHGKQLLANFFHQTSAPLPNAAQHQHQPVEAL